MREILEKRDEANNMVFMTTEFDLLKVLDRDVKVRQSCHFPLFPSSRTTIINLRM